MTEDAAAPRLQMLLRVEGFISSFDSETAFRIDWTGSPLAIAVYSKEVLSGTAGILTKEERYGAPLFFCDLYSIVLSPSSWVCWKDE